MRLLQTYQNLLLADLDRQLLFGEGLQATLIASDGRTIEKWTDYERNFGEGLSGSLYVEDGIFDRASDICRKLERKRNRSRIFNTYLLPVIIQAFMWGNNFVMTEGVKKQLASFDLPIKYAGAIVYSIWLVFETKEFIRKWRLRNLWYEKIDEKKAVRDFLTKIIMACALFAIAYFLY
ncbi:TPA: hypothetical protein DEP94_03395 [Candidatus Nomurabacteria bacterium]|nr:hypothetical protein [Candidatus Nomurabacteria bacterium]